MIDPAKVWYEALAQEVGIVIACDNPHRYANKLEETRRALGDPDLETITIVLSPVNPGELWLIKGQHYAAKRGIPTGESHS